MKNKSEDMKQTFDTIQERLIISQTGKVFINVNETEVQVDETDFEGNIKKVKKYEYDTDSVMVNNVTESNILAALKSKKKKESLDYYNSDDINLVEVQGVYVYLNPDLRFKIKERLVATKEKGIETTNLNFKSIRLDNISVDAASEMLDEIVFQYAKAYDVEQQHEINIDSFSTIEDVISYDYKSGYPEKLSL